LRTVRHKARFRTAVDVRHLSCGPVDCQEISMSLLLEHVRKTYREPDGRRLPVLGIERFELAQGEQVALLGASGGGKTTLLNIISGILTPDSGRVIVDGRDVAAMQEVVRDHFRAAKIGIVFQTFNLLPAFTALENVLLGMSFSGRGVDRAFARSLLERVGLGHRLNHSPARLSVGEQQRVAVARSLANKPALLLADEPTANVDPANQQLILDLIRDSCRDHNVTMLMVTHSLEVAGSFRRIERMQDFNRPELCLQEVAA
jgi:putative ABC transport system ATP-binding protein